MLLTAAAAQLRRFHHSHIGLTVPQLLSLAAALIAGKLTEVLLVRYAHGPDKKICQLIGTVVSIIIVTVSIFLL
ncbi:MAG: hypothetical protein IKQ39_03575 [Oscillospiraceae bacterium]|nr:hypothetical protein [Oscillospiraceae bacterium]